MSRSNTLLKQIGRLKKVNRGIIVIQAVTCIKCGYDFCTCPMTEVEREAVAPKYSY